MDVNSSDLKKPPTSSTASTTACGVPAVNSAIAARKRLLTTALVTSTRLKPKRRRIGAAVLFMAMAPAALAKVRSPDWSGVQAEAELEQQRQEEGKGAHADAVEKAAHDAGEEGVDLEQVEIEQRRWRVARVADIEPAADGARHEQRDHDRRREQSLADGGEAEGEAREPDAGQNEAFDVERRQPLFANVGDIESGEDHADEPDGNVDPEDPAPGDEGGDEAAERRTDHRSHQRRNGEPGERRDQLGFRHRPQDDQPSDRHHHGAAHALDDAEQDEIGEPLGEAAGRRAEREHDDGRAEHGAGAEAVGHPAAQRDKHGQRQEIRGERKLERDRVLVQIGGDGRQRRRDHRRIHRLHEEGDGDDEGDEIAGHVAGVRGALRRRWAKRPESVKGSRRIG